MRKREREGKLTWGNVIGKRKRSREREREREKEREKYSREGFVNIGEMGKKRERN